MSRELSIRITADNSQAQAALRQTEGALGDLGATAQKHGDAVMTYGQKLKQAYDTPGGLTNLKQNLMGLGTELRQSGMALSVGLTAPLVGLGVAAVATGADFERTMNLVAATTNASAVDMKMLGAAAIEWGQKTKFSNNEAAQAMLELSKAGFSAKDTIAALPAVLQMATAANMGLADAASLTANTMQTFGLQTKDLAHANDILVAAANASTIDVGDLRESLKFVGPVALAARVSLADVAGAAAALGGAGIKAEMAGTALRGMLSKLLAPSKDLKTLLVELGFEQEVNAGHTVSWTAMLDRLKVKMGEGAETADRFSGMVMKGFGQRAGPAVIALGEQGGAAVLALSNQFDHATGVAEKMSDAFMKGVSGSLEQLKGSLETVTSQLMVSLEPILVRVLTVATDLANWISGTLIPAFQALPVPIQTGVAVLAALVAAAGPVLLILGSMASGIGALVPLLGGLFGLVEGFGAEMIAAGVAAEGASVGVAAFSGALAILTGPVGWTIAAIVALGVIWIKWGDDIKAMFHSLPAPVQDVIEILGILTAAVAFPLVAIVGLGVAWVKWGDDIKRVVGEAYQAVKTWLWDKLEPVLTPIIGLVESVGAMFEAFAKLVDAVATKVYGYVAEMVAKVIVWLVEKLQPIFRPLGIAIEVIASVFTAAKDTVTLVVKAMYDVVKLYLIDKFTDIVKGVKDKVDAVTGFFKDMYDKVVGHSYVPDMVDRTRDEFGRFQKEMVDPTKIATASVTEAFRIMGVDVGGYLTDLINATHGGLDGLQRYGWDFAKGFVSTALDTLVPGLGQLVNAAWPVIQAGLTKLGGLIKSALGGIWHGIKSLFGFGGDSAPSAPQTPEAAAALTMSGNLSRAQEMFDYGGPSAGYFLEFMNDHPELWGNGVGFAQGTRGQYLDFGAGTLAMLHGRERVMTEAEGKAEARQSGGVTVIVQAIDSVDVKTWLRRGGARDIAEALPKHLLKAGV